MCGSSTTSAALLTLWLISPGLGLNASRRRATICFGEMLVVEVERGAHHQALARVELAGREQLIELVFDDPDKMRRLDGIGRWVVAQRRVLGGCQRCGWRDVALLLA